MTVFDPLDCFWLYIMHLREGRLLAVCGIFLTILFPTELNIVSSHYSVLYCTKCSFMSLLCSLLFSIHCTFSAHQCCWSALDHCDERVTGSVIHDTCYEAMEKVILPHYIVPCLTLDMKLNYLRKLLIRGGTSKF